MISSNKPKVYMCNPLINTECTKTGCYLNNGECMSTTKPKYAYKGTDGQPIINESFWTSTK